MRVLIVEDSVLLREGLGRILAEYGDEVVAALGDARTTSSPTVEATAPDVVIADVRMPPTHTDEGLRAAIELRRLRPGTPVLVLSQYVEERYASELLSADTEAVGYLLKERVADVADFVDAVHRVAEGGTVLDPEVVAQLLARRRSRTAGHPDAARARGAGADGGGPVERRHRPGPRRVRRRRREAHLVHLRTARAGARRTPSTAGCWPSSPGSAADGGRGEPTLPEAELAVAGVARGRGRCRPCR